MPTPDGSDNAPVLKEILNFILFTSSGGGGSGAGAGGRTRGNCQWSPAQ